MTEPTTPTERAVDGLIDACFRLGLPVDAAATSMAYERGKEVGARQERERLRAEWQDTIGVASSVGVGFVNALLAEPQERDR
ncbi:hypothetical protein BH23CHL8_BH23CHL8_24240 [soil metagenome]